MIRNFRQWILWTVAWVREHFGAKVEFVPVLTVSEPLRAVSDATDDRTKQRHRKKMAGVFIEALDGVADSVVRMSMKPKQLDKAFGWVNVECCPALQVLFDKYTDLSFRSRMDELHCVPQIANLDTTFLCPDSDDETEWALHRIQRVHPWELRSEFPMLVPGAHFYSHTLSFSTWKNLATAWVYLTRDAGEHWACMWRETRGAGATRIEALTDEDDKEYPWLSSKWIQGVTWQRNLDDVAWCLRMRRGPVKLICRCTDSVARELLMLRDSGGRRRDAALHWVTDHDRIVNGRVKRVKAHLRGKKEFTWGRWQCSLEEAVFDRDALATSRRLPTAQIEPRQEIYHQKALAPT